MGHTTGGSGLNCVPVARILHTSDLHFGRTEVGAHLEHLRKNIESLKPDAVAVSGDLTQSCSPREFEKARDYLDRIRKTAPVIVVPGNHDIRWLGAVARNLGLFGQRAHEYKYSRYKRYISEELSSSLEVPGAVIAGLNTAHGISRGSLTGRFRDLGVIGHVKREDVEKVKEAFSGAESHAARIVMIHHNPIEGETTGRHGLANTSEALRALSEAGAELILCGHDHQEAIHTAEQIIMPRTSRKTDQVVKETYTSVEDHQSSVSSLQVPLDPGLVISTAGTVSSRLRAGRPASFNLVETSGEKIRITTYTWEDSEFHPSQSFSFERGANSRTA